MSTPPQDVISVHVKTELQYDVNNQQGALPSGSVSQLAVTSNDVDQLLSIYYISNGAVFDAHQTPDSATAGAANWSVDNMGFPAKNPFVVRALSIPNTKTDMVVVVTQDGSHAYMMTTGVRYPTWTLLPSTPNGAISDCRPFITSDSNVWLAAMSGSGMFITDPANAQADGWNEDVGVRGAFSGTIQAFDIDLALGSTVNSTNFGYAVASSSNGLGLLTGGSFNLKVVAQLINVDPGSYTSVSLAPLPNQDKLTMPLVFAVDKSANAFYFQISATGTYTKVPILSGIKVAKLETVIRSKLVEGTGIPFYWVEVFALGLDDNIYHLESAYDDINNVNSFIQLTSNNWVVNAWRANTAQISTAVNDVAVAATSDGNALLLTYSNNGQSNTMKVINQDPETSDYITNAVQLPAIVTSNTAIQQSTVYYVEASILDGNRMPAFGRAAVISSTQYSVININGRVVAVDTNRTATALTNASGSICFTMNAPDGFGVPTFTLWAEGMEPDAVIDVQPNGDIQSTLASLDVATMRAATDNTDPNKPPLFPTATVTDDQLTQAAAGVKEVIAIVDPGFDSRDVPLEDIPHSAPTRRYVHHRTKAAVAYGRRRGDRPLGRVRGKADHGVHLKLRPHIKTTRIDSHQAKQLRDQMVEGFLGFDVSWGDLWDGVKKGFYIVKEVILDPIADGIKTTVNFLIDTVEYAWNGLVDFVQKAYDVVMDIFDAIGAGFEKLFGWLAWLLDWDDIKRTAAQFQNTINGFQSWSSNLLNDVLPQITQDGFNQLKTWITANFAAAEAAMGSSVVGTFDKDSPPNLNNSLTDSGQGLLEDLPSTATWLMNKIFNAGGGDAGALNFTRAMTVLESLWSNLLQNVETVGLNTDLQNAYTSLGDMLKTFGNRGVFDATSWVSLLEVAKNFILVVLDVVELACLSLEKVFAEVVNFFFEVLNAPLDIPLVSSVFKYLTGVTLTLTNTACFVLAIPYNIVYKVITGTTPFTLSGPEGTPVDDVNVSRGVMSVLTGLYISIADFTVTPTMATQPTWLKRTIAGLNIATSSLVVGLGGYPAVQSASTAIQVFWAITGFTPVLLNVTFLVVTRGDKLPPGHPAGLITMALTGVGQLVAAVWETVVTKNWTPKASALVAAYWFAPWTNLFRWMVKYAAANAYVRGTQLVINLVCGLGNGISLIVAGTSSDTLAVLQSPNHHHGHPKGRGKGHRRHRHHPKAIEYHELKKHHDA